MLAQTDTRRGNLSFCLGGKALSDPETWKPNMEAVRATIKFAIAIRRLDREVEHAANNPQQYILSLSLTPTNPITLVSPAGLALVAEDRTLNTWRSELQAYSLLTTHEVLLNKAGIGAGRP